MKLKILGSVSPYPNKKCNCPSYLITEKNIKILLDCGPGITKFLKLPADLTNLTIIISHLHKDHYGDLLSLAYATYVYHKLGYINKKVKVYLPKTPPNDYSYLTSIPESYLKFIPYNETTTLQISPFTITFYKTLHNIETYAIRLNNSIHQISYSADTGYDENLIPFIFKSSLFLCESTFLKDQKGLENNHLSTIEAATLASKAQVDLLILTHFWPEIPKSIYLKEAQEIFPRTTIAEESQIFSLKKIKSH